jgi:hypothetical protein
MRFGGSMNMKKKANGLTGFVNFSLPSRPRRMQKNFYLDTKVIDFIAEEAERLECSGNEFVTGLVNFYKANVLDLGIAPERNTEEKHDDE